MQQSTTDEEPHYSTKLHTRATKSFVPVHRLKSRVPPTDQMLGSESNQQEERLDPKTGERHPDIHISYLLNTYIQSFEVIRVQSSVHITSKENNCVQGSFNKCHCIKCVIS